jgi:hypothetical protein
VSFNFLVFFFPSELNNRAGQFVFVLCTHPMGGGGGGSAAQAYLLALSFFFRLYITICKYLSSSLANEVLRIINLSPFVFIFSTREGGRLF